MVRARVRVTAQVRAGVRVRAWFNFNSDFNSSVELFRTGFVNREKNTWGELNNGTKKPKKGGLRSWNGKSARHSQATDARVSLERMRRRFTQHLALLHLTDAWHVALQLKMPEVCVGVRVRVGVE